MGEVARLPAMSLAFTFTGNVGPSEVPPLTGSGSVDPSRLGLVGLYYVVASRTNECGCRVDFALTVKGPSGLY